MKKNVFIAIIAIIASIIVGSLVRVRGYSTDASATDRDADTADVDTVRIGYDSLSCYEIETLSDKDIYFKADTALPDIPVVNDMLDLANGYAILRAAYCDAELWFRLGGVVNEEISQIKVDVIKDKAIQAAAKEYVETLVNILPRDTALWNQSDSILWKKVISAYMHFADKLSSRFSLDHYGKITEKDVMDYMDVKQFIPDYDSIYKLRKSQTESNKQRLLKLAKQAPSFDAKCLYTVEIAHQKSFEDTPMIISMLQDLMVSGAFTRYLHEVWRTWRCMRQLAMTPSRDGAIPNLVYNKMRYRCLNTILRQIIKNPQDIKAINDYCYLATYDNITRYSEYPYGNSVGLEHMMLFPEILDDDNKQ